MAFVNVIVDLGFGDSGKGLVTSCLSDKNSLVVRYCGGHQAGHTVIKNGFRHVFSSFGAGTMNGADTYISEYCTVYPVAFVNEYNTLTQNGYKPRCFIHPMAMITTPFDVEFNRRCDYAKGGSVGVGFGATVQRHEGTPFKLYMLDMSNLNLFKHKLRQIAKWYVSENVEEKIEAYMEYVNAMKCFVAPLSEIKGNYKTINFEGAQGVMLDRDFGYFPDVTRASTTSRNAMKIIQDNNLFLPTIYYVMRSYSTRHGNGFMPYEGDLGFEDHTNKENEYQGKFRQGSHCIDQLRYAIMADSIYNTGSFRDKYLVINHLDQTNDRVLVDGYWIYVDELTDKLDFDFSKGDDTGVIRNHSAETTDFFSLKTV